MRNVCIIMHFRYGVMHDEERRSTKSIFMRTDFSTPMKVSGRGFVSSFALE